MNRQELILENEDTINQIYLQEHLSCLRGIYKKFTINNRQIICSFLKIVENQKSSFDCIKLIEEFIFISDEIMYFTAQLFFSKPYINNPLNNEVYINGNSSEFPNRQSIASKRYFMFVDVTFEKVYNFWNRIGNLIALFFQEEFTKKSDKIYFEKAIDRIPIEFQKIESYKKLKHFRENEYRIMNGKRKQIVHNISLDTNFRLQHLENSTNREEIEKWIVEILSFAEYFKSQIVFTIEGFDNTLSFLEEVKAIKSQDMNSCILTTKID